MIVTILGVLFVYVTLGFLVSVVVKRNDIADVMWGPGIFIAALTSVYYTQNYEFSLFLVLIFLWALRIFSHIGFRFIKKESENPRYKVWRDSWKYFYLRSYFQVFILQGFLMFLVSATFVFVTVRNSYSIYFLFLGATISLFALVFEAVADLQLNRFISDKTNAGKILTTGLWKFSRHPNYFGEVTFWWGLFIATLPTLNPIFLVSPLIISYLILYISGIPILERRYIGNSEFEKYKQKTNTFFPWFPKK